MDTAHIQRLSCIVSIIFIVITIGCEREQCSCAFIGSNADKFKECTKRANAGDAEAAFSIAKIYDSHDIFNADRFLLPIKSDNNTAFHYYKIAANSGNAEASEIVFDSYNSGIYGPENKSEADSCLLKFSNMGHEWAMLKLAYRYEKDNPQESIELYSRLASINNRHAQKRLSELYIEGEIVPGNPCKAYFWFLIATIGLKQYEYMDRISTKIELENTLGEKHVKVVQDAASLWQIGQTEPDLPKLKIKQEEPSVNKIIVTVHGISRINDG